MLISLPYSDAFVWSIENEILKPKNTIKPQSKINKNTLEYALIVVY